jgi:hypothetical protein
MTEDDLTFNQWCVEIANIIYYNTLTETDYEYYYEKYLDYLDTH